MNQRFKQNIYHANVNINLMVESVTEIKSGITINVDASVKTHLICKRIIFGLLPQEVIKCLHKNCFDKFIDTVSVFCC